MSTVNLQLEGLMIAIASINQLLVSKGIVTDQEMALSLEIAEQSVLGENRVNELDPAQRDAVVFPIRLLLLANHDSSETGVLPFSELAKMIGQTKDRYNDQQ
ncbi:MAG TPA: hypothetical protein VL147_12050 [Devosia sp.]|nr:hypothetical protein [Devosia sp.]